MSNPVEKEIEVSYWKTNLGLFVKPFANQYYGYPSCSGYFINGIDCTTLETRGGYLFIPDTQEITSVAKKTAGESFIEKYTLNNVRLVSAAVPLELPGNLDVNYDGDNLEFVDDSFKGLYSLYEPVRAYTPPSVVEVPFKVVLLGSLTVSDHTDARKMKVDVAEGNYGGKKQTTNLSSIVSYSDIEQMLSPGFALDDRPCSITSAQVYKIVRQHIIDNIDPTVAKITSNYDFCFTVKKIIPVKPFTIKKEKKTRTGNSYRPPKFENDMVSTKEVEIFQMTDDVRKYEGYTPIQGWSASNLTEMANNLKEYLDDLMETINAKLVICPSCQGAGCNVQSIGTNKRKDIP